MSQLSEHDNNMSNAVVSEGAPPNEPKDRYNIVNFIFKLLGLSVLIPWNFFITANDYFTTKLNTSESETCKDLVVSFPNSQTMAAMIPYAIFSVVNLYLTNFCKPSYRFHAGNTTVFLCFIVTISLVEVQLTCQAFFAITMVLIMSINVASAILQGATYGILSFLPPKHVGGYLEGQAVAGILAALANIIVISASNDKMASATAYFAIALTFIAMATVLFLLLPRNPHYVHYMQKLSESQVKLNPLLDEEARTDDLGVEQQPSAARNTKNKLLTCTELFQSLKEPGAMGFAAFFSLYVTLSVYPSLFLGVIFTSPAAWKDKYFIAVLVFLLFNVCDYLGRKAAVLIKWPRQDQPKLVTILCLTRLLIVFAVMFANQANKRYFPVLFHHEAFVPVMILLLGLSNGYLLTLAFLYAPSYAAPGREERVGVAMGLYVALGLGLGVATSFPLKLLL